MSDMDSVNVCPRCGRPIEPREGRAVVLSRRVRLDKTNEHGEIMGFIPGVTCMIVECTNLENGCDYLAAGSMNQGVFEQDEDLVPMARVMSVFMRHREERGHDGPTTL